MNTINKRTLSNNAIERTRQLFVFVHLTNQMEFLIHVRSLTKQTNVNELPAKRFMNCSLNVRFVYSPIKLFRPRIILPTGQE
ncbi:hypothetical protein Hanom_Chr02g00176951 [Helianthus anomalus]